MKKKTTSNPLKTFNDNKAKAYMKAGGAMKAFKKSLPKAQLGQGNVNDVNYYDQNKVNAKRVQMMDSISLPNQYTVDSGRMQFVVPKPKFKPVNVSGPGSGMGSMYMDEMQNQIPQQKKGGVVIVLLP
jgi:hypothetical protein